MAGKRMNDGRTDVAGFCGFNNRLGNVSHQVREVRLHRLTPANPNRRETGRLANGFVHLAGELNIPEHCFQKGFCLGVGLFRCRALHQVEHVGRNACAAFMQEVIDLLVRKFKSRHCRSPFSRNRWLRGACLWGLNHLLVYQYITPSLRKSKIQ